MTEEQRNKLVVTGRRIAIGWLDAEAENSEFKLDPEYEFAAGDFILVKDTCKEMLNIDLHDVIVPKFGMISGMQCEMGILK